MLMIVFSNIAPNFDSTSQVSSLIGFLIWNLCIGLIDNTTKEVMTEANEGTVELFMMATLAPVELFWWRGIAAATIQSIQTFGLGILLACLLSLSVIIPMTALIILGLTLIGTLGACLALGGLALIYKQTSSVTGVFSLLALFATGALVPLNDLSFAFQFMKWIIPTAWGIDILRAMILEGETFVDLLSNWTVLGLTTQSLIFVVMGVFVLSRSVEMARRNGSLHAY